MNLLVSELALTDHELDRAILWSDAADDFAPLMPHSPTDDEPVARAEARPARRHWLLSAPRLTLLRRVFAESN
jgi:hypothetical protein